MEVVLLLLSYWIIAIVAFVLSIWIIAIVAFVFINIKGKDDD